MARSQKTIPPSNFQVTPLTALIPLMRAFHVDSDKIARSLIADASKAIYGKTEWGTDSAVSKNELDEIISLMRCLNPNDTLESLYAAQIIVCHMLGMRKLSENYLDDQKLGLNLLKFSNEAMRQLEKKKAVRCKEFSDANSKEA